MNRKYKVVIAGASGLVGRTMVRVLEEREFPVAELVLLASERSKGMAVPVHGKDILIRQIQEHEFEGADIVLFALESGSASEWIPKARKHAAIVIDNSSYYRLDPEVPLVVPEVNPEDIFSYNSNLVANPNCSTIQMVAALKPLHDVAQIERIVVSTYQAVSGAGQVGVNQFTRELAGDTSTNEAFAYPVTQSPLPHIAQFEANGYTNEENKMVAETKKIMHAPGMHIVPTCVRVPIANCHSEAVYIECKQPLSAEAAREALRNTPGIIVKDDITLLQYPLVTDADGRDEVFVGRIREDTTVQNGLVLWIVADNLRKGAATNAVQIAEYWIRRREDNTAE